ncbi:MAG: S8 family serine peptidase [Clostridia bacterium]|nr:S8 family serine peptidase [Clostridia bacterium]
MKKLYTIAALLLCTVLLPTPLSAAEEERVQVLISADNPGEGFAALQAVCPDSELIAGYDLLFSGFAAEIPSYALTAVDAHFEYTIAGSYLPQTIDEGTDIAAAVTEAADTDYNGEGMCIALLDTGFVLTHESFILTHDSPKLTKESVDTLIPSLSMYSADAEPVSYYVSAKIPFAYNYADNSADVSGLPSHGTAMLSAAAGNAANLPERQDGEAPEAQVLAMKVYSDIHGTATEASLLSAMEDAVKLGADVICLSLGEACGFADSSVSGVSLSAAIAKAEEMGVIVVASAGNSGKHGKESVYDEEYAISSPTTDNPDNGTIYYPGSVPEVFCAGSAESNIVTADCLLLPDGTKLPYGDSNYMYTLPSGGKSFTAHFAGQTLEYVFVRSFGDTEDFPADVDFTGKLAVIDRGSITFNEKTQNAAARSAVGVIIIDNQPDPQSALSVKMDLTEAPIPAIIVSAASGTLLREAPVHQITVDPAQKYSEKRRETPTPSTFTARGVTPELTLKPDITVVGEYVECASYDGTYKTYSGTSVSAARLAGMSVCVKQRLIAEEGSASPSRVKNLLVSSAQLMTQLAGGLPYSPRTQGGGSVDLSGALNAGILLSSDGNHKIECGETDGRWLSFSITAENLTDSDQLCTLDALVGGSSYDSFTFSELDTAKEGETTLAERLGKQLSDTISFASEFTSFQNARVMIGDLYYQLNADASDYDPYTFTLKANSSTTIRVSVLLDEETYREYNDIFSNGCFLEGYIRLTTENEQASIPFISFMGDWGQAPALDASVYDGVEAVYAPTSFYRSVYTGHYSGEMTLGTNPFLKVSIPDGDALVFSPVVDGSDRAIWLDLGLLRSISDAELSITDESGKEVWRQEHEQIIRTFLDPDTGMMTSARLRLWDGRAMDNSAYIYPDGLYTLTLSYRVAASDTYRKASWTIRLDTEKPSATYKLAQNGEDWILIVTAEDNYCPAEVVVSDMYDALADVIHPLNEENIAVFDLRNMTDRYIYIEVYDLAMNSQMIRIDNPNYIEE